MSTEFPQHLDPWRAAAARQHISARIAVTQLRRLHDKLDMSALSAEAGIHFSADFSRDDHGRPLIHLSIQGQVPLRCQRSLCTYLQELDAESWVVVVRDEDEAERVSEEHEPVLLNEKALALRDLVEEEILLALPLVPMDPDSAAITLADVQVDAVEELSPTGGDTASNKNAFAVLAELIESQKPAKGKGKAKKTN